MSILNFSWVQSENVRVAKQNFGPAYWVHSILDLTSQSFGPINSDIWLNTYLCIYISCTLIFRNEGVSRTSWGVWCSSFFTENGSSHHRGSRRTKSKWLIFPEITAVLHKIWPIYFTTIEQLVIPFGLYIWSWIWSEKENLSFEWRNVKYDWLIRKNLNFYWWCKP